MTAKFFAILTSQGAALLANATALGTKLNITQMAVGDGNGTLPTPDATQTKLVNQKRIAPLNMLSIDANNASQIIAEQVIPENEGGFWIREIGLYDDNGVLIAVANCPETYKPQLQEGSGRTQTIRMVLIVSSTAAVTLKIDPSVVLATRQYVDNAVIEVKAYADNLLKQHIADTNPHKQYAPLASPVFTGTPKAPTAAQTSNDTQLANTAFVQAAIAALVSGELAKKQPLDKTLTELSGKNVAAILEYLGLGTAATKNVGTGANQIPDMSAFTSGANWFMLPGGFIVQFFTALMADTSAATKVVSFPFAFPNGAISVVATHNGSQPGIAGIFGINNLSKTTFQSYTSVTPQGSIGAFIIAVGH
ncbi:phage tail protein [Kosakonia radicincitans]|uniref:phage tail protein n=1 Tax=Kosakonia radicincitans TaxID=283686 RepID=UPI0031D8B379